MKRIVCFLALISSIFIMDNVKAEEIKKDNIENGTYIIGTHIFNREQNDNYDGTLKIEHIMLASRTIEVYDLEHMKIYYKNARGKWVNPTNNEALDDEDVPTAFDIEYKNLNIYDFNQEAKYEADLVYTAIKGFCATEDLKTQIEPSYVAKCADGTLSSVSVAAMVTTNAIVNATVSQFKLTSLIVELYGFVYELKDDKMVLSSTINNPLSNDEISNIETFINEPLNNAFILMNYNSIDEIFIDRKVSNRTNYDILKYSINSSEFSRPASAIEIESIWNGEAKIETRVATLDQFKSFIKLKTNYDMTQNDIENLSTYYNEELGLFVFMISDEIFERHEIVSGYKSNGYYYVYLEDGTIVVLTKENNNYYFNSCDNTSLGDSIIDK